MAKSQTRRSISISRSTYDRLKAYCMENGRTCSDVVESEVRKMLKLEPRAEEILADRRARILRAAAERKDAAVAGVPVVKAPKSIAKENHLTVVAQVKSKPVIPVSSSYSVDFAEDERFGEVSSQSA